MERKFIQQVKNWRGDVVYESKKVGDAERFMLKKIKEGTGNYFTFDNRPATKDDKKRK